MKFNRGWSSIINPIGKLLFYHFLSCVFLISCHIFDSPPLLFLLFLVAIEVGEVSDEEENRIKTVVNFPIHTY